MKHYGTDHVTPEDFLTAIEEVKNEIYQNVNTQKNLTVQFVKDANDELTKDIRKLKASNFILGNVVVVSVIAIVALISFDVYLFFR